MIRWGPWVIPVAAHDDATEQDAEWLTAVSSIERKVLGAWLIRGLRNGRNVQKRIAALGPYATVRIICAQIYKLFGSVLIMLATLVVPSSSGHPGIELAGNLMFVAAGAFVVLNIYRVVSSRPASKRWRSTHAT